MKTVLILFLLVFSIISKKVPAQFACSNTVPAVIDLESEMPSGHNLFIDTLSNPNNLWAIATPDKPVINSAHSTPNVLITDSVNSYPVNDTSSFVVSHITTGGFEYQHTARISFWYWSDTDSLNDYGTIEFSPNNGEWWYSLLDSWVVDFIDWYSDPPTLTGSSDGWKEAYANLAAMGEVDGIQYGDTVLFRFTFISDSIPDDRDGLAFDNFQFCDFYEGIEGHEYDEISSIAFPNPTEGSITIEFENSRIDPFDLEIFSVDSRLVESISDLRDSKITLDISYLVPGLYFYSLKSETSEKIARGRIIVAEN